MFNLKKLRLLIVVSMVTQTQYVHPKQGKLGKMALGTLLLGTQCKNDVIDAKYLIKFVDSLKFAYLGTPPMFLR